MRRLSLGLILFILAFGLAGNVMAQETPLSSPPPNTGEVDPLPSPPPNTGEGTPGALAGLLNFVTGALVGAAASLAGLFALVGRLKSDKAALDAIEWLGKSIPVDALDKLNEMGRNLRDAGEVLDKVTDGQPNAVIEAAEDLTAITGGGAVRV